MSTRQLTHPAFPGVAKTVQAAQAKKWEASGWVPESQTSTAPVAKKTTPKKAQK